MEFPLDLKDKENKMKLHEWLKIFQEEYLKSYILKGGAGVKFLVPEESIGHEKIYHEVKKISIMGGYVVVSIDSATTKIHLIEKIFHEVAKQIDWDDLAHHFLWKTFKDNGYEMSPNQDQWNLHQIANLNRREEKLLRRDVNTWLEKGIYRDYSMSQEFRIAMIRLCQAQLDPEAASPFMANAVKEWLRGELALISSLKEALIYQKISRHNARHMLFSLAHWLKVNGKSGLILLLDISRYAVTTRSRDESDGFFYSIPAALDAYEVMRQFIDGTDEMESCLILALASKPFLSDERRGVSRYDALKLRIWDEVRDKKRENPFASLIRISSL